MFATGAKGLIVGFTQDKYPQKFSLVTRLCISQNTLIRSISNKSKKVLQEYHLHFS